jgi:hypothetical protein
MDAWMDELMVNMNMKPDTRFLFGTVQEAYKISRAGINDPILQMMRLRFKKLSETVGDTVTKC